MDDNNSKNFAIYTLSKIDPLPLAAISYTVARYTMMYDMIYAHNSTMVIFNVVFT